MIHLPDPDLLIPSIPRPLPSWLEGLIAVAKASAALAAAWGCWFAFESPAVRHALHRYDPLCWRCERAAAMRAERARHRTLIAQLRTKYGREGRNDR